MKLYSLVKNVCNKRKKKNCRDLLCTDHAVEKEYNQKVLGLFQDLSKHVEVQYDFYRRKK